MKKIGSEWWPEEKDIQALRLQISALIEKETAGDKRKRKWWKRITAMIDRNFDQFSGSSRTFWDHVLGDYDADPGLYFLFDLHGSVSPKLCYIANLMEINRRLESVGHLVDGAMEELQTGITKVPELDPGEVLFDLAEECRTRLRKLGVPFKKSLRKLDTIMSFPR